MGEPLHWRCARIRAQGFDRTDPVSFNVAPHRDYGYVFNAEQCIDDGLLEFRCFEIQDLLIHLLNGYPSILDKYSSVKDFLPYPESSPKRDFLFMPDKYHEKHQEPFIIIEFENFDTEQQKKKYFANLDDFLSTFRKQN